jgi:hypothetical protein
MTPPGPKSISQVALVDVATGGSVPAEFWQPITEKNLADWEAHWRPAIQEQLLLLNDAGVGRHLWPQSREWDWRKKHNVLCSSFSNESAAVMAAGVTQGMMIVDLDFRARIEEQARQHMVYVDFLEVAPWNRKTLTGGMPQYVGIGTLLIGKAIDRSLDLGFKGRIGLHSLPQSNDFYANQCGMRDLGSDANYNKLRYFEMTPDMAEGFLMRGEQRGR